MLPLKMLYVFRDIALLLIGQVVFITEYMSSGSLRQFLRKTKRGSRTLKASFCKDFIIVSILCSVSYL